MGSPSSAASEPDEACLVHSVAAVLALEPSLEAVTIDNDKKSITLATLGNRSDPILEARVAETVRRAQSAPNHSRCGFLLGEQACEVCDLPFAPYERQSVSIRTQANATTIARVTCPTSPSFWHWRKIPWPVLAPRQMEALPDEAHVDEWKAQLGCASLCGVLALAAPFFSGYPRLGLFSLSYLLGSWFAAKEVVELLRERKLDVHFLMLAVAVGSASIGAWGEGAVLLFLFSISGALEHYALGRTRKEIQALFKSKPRSAWIVDEQGREREVAIEAVQRGARLLIRPDTQFPVDAEVVKGSTAADESNLTGEATSVDKGVGDTVLAGTLNLWGAVEALALRPEAESALQRIIRLIQDAQKFKAPAQRITDKFGTPYTYAILAASLIMFFVWHWVMGLPAWTSSYPEGSAFYRAMTLLVVASPCALVLSIPSAVLAAIAAGARRGILFRGGAAVERLADINVVALDKTGTLTTGELRVERVESQPPGKENEIARLAFSLERFSSHPAARAITRHGKRNAISPLTAELLESVPGAGVKARVAGQVVLVGRRDWALAGAVSGASGEKPAAELGFSEVWVSAGELSGRIILRDDIRPEASSVLERCRDAGLHTVVLTGDHKQAAEHLQQKLKLPDVRSELRPEQKVAIIQELMRQGKTVAMVGDGVNDAPSLAAADIGIAMGSRGSDAALEQAGVVLMHDRIESFWAAYRLSQRARRIIRQNLAISLGTVAILAVFALFGAIPLSIGVLGHEGSTVLVVLNSLRILVASHPAGAGK